MARKTAEQVHIRIRTSFNEVRRGDEAVVVLDAVVQGWLDAGLAEVVDGGTDPAGPGGTEPDDHERDED